MVSEVQGAKDLSMNIQGAGNVLLLIYFYATWCGPCSLVETEIEKLEKEFPNVVYLKVNVDGNDEIVSEYEVKSVPAFAFVKEGKKVNSFSGPNLSSVKYTLAMYS